MVYTEPVLLTGREASIRALFIIMAILPTIAVILRLWSRALLPGSSHERPMSRYWWDDWTVILATVWLG
jgi:hypothetical protein